MTEIYCLIIFGISISIFFCFIDFPELTSIETKASVGFITKYPPDFNLTVGS